MKSSKLQEAISELDSLDSASNVSQPETTGWHLEHVQSSGIQMGKSGVQMRKAGAISFDGLRTLMNSIGQKGADPDLLVTSPASLALSSLSLSSPEETLGSYVVHADPTAIPEGYIQISDTMMNWLLEHGEVEFIKGGAKYRVALSPDMGTTRHIRATSEKTIYLPIKLSGALLQSAGPIEKRRFPNVLMVCSGGREDGKVQETLRTRPYL